MYQNLIVTGGCGFIGTNFIRYVLEETDFSGRIINVDILTYAGNPLSLADIADKYGDRYVFVKADICDYKEMLSVVEQYDVDSICHFAAESHVDRSILHPDDFINTNIIGTYNLLKVAYEKIETIKRFHHVSTDEVFGSLGAEGLFREDTPYAPNSPYSASKASSDHLVRAYCETFGVPVTMSNCSNNYGPYQFPEKLVPLMILNALEGKALPVYGDGQNVRDWLFVKDHCIAIWEIMFSGVVGETYNVGGRNEMKNLDVVKVICNLVDEVAEPLASGESRESLISFVKDRLGHDRRYAIDCNKIDAELGWTPSESFETGIRKTVKWYLSNMDWSESVRTGEYQNWIKENYL
ncbi:MAG: dTDP-glucose 4,6-dehydratase [Kiritimatiellae bacterium]|jgi:dTDP-glucose 4,6-dehydratase|nr:dTDP-glucose 4,6-dehydratase [Kiritimatiellia bacterium]